MPIAKAPNSCGSGSALVLALAGWRGLYWRGVA